MKCLQCNDDLLIGRPKFGKYCSEACEDEAIRISKLNAESFDKMKNGFQIIHGSETWVAPKVVEKTKQKQKIIDLEKALSIFDAVHTRHMNERGRVDWEKEPAVVIVELLSRAFQHGDGYAITYNDASRIMESAKSGKMGGRFNLGIDEIKQAWQKNYIGEV